MAQILKKNGALEILNKVADVLEGGHTSLPPGVSPSNAAALKYCPIASVDVERSFSQFKNVFSDRRRNFSEENLAKTVIANFFYARMA